MSAATQAQTTGHRDGGIIPVALAASVQIYKGAAAAIVIGTGYGLPLVPTTLTHQFIGVWGESLLSSSTAGATFTQVFRKGLYQFASTGITAASINEPVYFIDDHTVTLTAGTTYAGVIAAVDAAGLAWVDIENAVRDSSNSGKDWIILSASGAIAPHEAANYIITKAGIAALTLAAPTAGIDDGLVIAISSSTLYAHTLTATNLLSTGVAGVSVATFAAYAGAGLTLKAYNGLWQVMSSVGITFT